MTTAVVRSITSEFVVVETYSDLQVLPNFPGAGAAQTKALLVHPNTVSRSGASAARSLFAVSGEHEEVSLYRITKAGGAELLHVINAKPEKKQA